MTVFQPTEETAEGAQAMNKDATADRFHDHTAREDGRERPKS